MESGRTEKILTTFATFLPSFQSIGCNQVKKESFFTIYNACLHSPEMVFSIISNEYIYGSLSLEEFLQIVSCNEEIVQAIIGNEACYDILNGDCLTFFSKVYLSIPRKILDTQQLREKLCGRHLAEISIVHYLLAKEIINSFWGQLSRFDIAKICAAHFSIAEKIFLNNDSLEKLCGDNSAESGYHLATVGSAFLSIAEKIFDEPHLREKLGTYNLTTLGVAHVTMVKKIFTFPELCKKLDAHSLVAFHNVHPSLAEDVAEIAKKYGIMGEYSTILNRRMSLSPNKNADEIILENMNAFELNCAGNAQLSVLKKILETPALRNNLSSYNLEKFEQAIKLVNTINELSKKTNRLSLTF